MTAPTPPDKFFKKALKLICSEKYKKAIKALKKSIEINPNYFNAYSGISTIMIMQNKNEEALEWINKAITYEKKTSDLWYTKALILRRLKRLDDSLERLDKCLELEPNNISALALKAYIFIQRGQYEEALNYLDKALSINPKDEADQAAQMDARKNRTWLIEHVMSQENMDKPPKKLIDLKDKLLDLCDLLFKVRFLSEQPLSENNINFKLLEDRIKDYIDSLAAYIYGEDNIKIMDIYQSHKKLTKYLENIEPIKVFQLDNRLTELCAEILQYLEEQKALEDLPPLLKDRKPKKRSVIIQDLQHQFYSLGAILKSANPSKNNLAYQTIMLFIELLGSSINGKETGITGTKLIIKHFKEYKKKVENLKRKTAEDLNLNQSDYTLIIDALESTISLMSNYSTNIITIQSQDKRKLRKAPIHKKGSIDYVGEDLILDIGYLLTELTYKMRDKKYPRLFMVFKHLYDSIGYYIYSDNTLKDIQSYYVFAMQFTAHESMKFLKTLPINRQIENIYDGLTTLFDQHGSRGGIYFVLTPPGYNESDKREMDLKLLMWRLGCCIRIDLRTLIKRGDILHSSLIELLEILMRGIYSGKRLDHIKDETLNFKPKVEVLRHKTPKELGVSERGYRISLKRLDYTLNGVLDCFK